MASSLMPTSTLNTLDDPSPRKYCRSSVASKSAAVQARPRHGEAKDEGDRGDGPDCGNGRDEAGGAARAAGSDKRRRRSGSYVGIRRDRVGLALDLDRSPRP